MSGPLALLVAVVTLFAGCAAGTAPTSPASRPTVTQPGATYRPATSPTRPSAPAPAQTSAAPTASQCAARVVAKLSPRQQAGQLVMVGVTSASDGELAVLRRQSIGSVILMGQHTDGVRGVRRVTARLAWKGQQVPLLVAVDQEGGLVQRLKGSGFDTIASAKVQATWSSATLRSRAERWGRQLASAGVTWTLAPVADVVPGNMVTRNAPIGRLGRGYGSDPATVAAKVSAFVKGMQAAGVTTSAKHFPGIGRVIGNTDFTAGVKDGVTSVDDPYLRPFQAAVEAGAGSVMVSTVTYTRIDASHPAVFSAKVVGLIRTRLGFDGVVISDDLGAARSMASVPASTRAIGFVRAGGDLAITVDPALADEFVGGIVSAAKVSPAVAAQVSRAATRVVTLKVQQGLLPCG